MKTKRYVIAETFGISAPAAMTVEGFEENNHPFVPTLKPYVFRREHLRDLLAFLENPSGDGLYAFGPTGSGKTSLFVQAAARLHWPVQQVTCHGRLELNDLVGQFMLSNGTMSFVHGPLAKAMQEGHLLILNEIDLMDPSELAGLNDILEGMPLSIPQNGGELIKPHPKFRVIATANSNGQGDQSGLHSGIMRQNIALMDRFRMIEIGYPDPDAEKRILSAALSNLGVSVDAVMEQIMDNMIATANEIRKLFVGSADNPGELSVTLSTRTLERWAHLMVANKRAPNALSYALDRALTNRAEPAQREAIHRIAMDIFGDSWGSPS